MKSWHFGETYTIGSHYIKQHVRFRKTNIPCFMLINICVLVSVCVQITLQGRVMRREGKTFRETGNSWWTRKQKGSNRADGGWRDGGMGEPWAGGQGEEEKQRSQCNETRCFVRSFFKLVLLVFLRAFQVPLI